MSRTLRERIDAIRQYLPPIPGVFAELVQDLNDETADTRAVGQVIGRDPSVTTSGDWYRLKDRT